MDSMRCELRQASCTAETDAKQSALADRQRAATFGRVGPAMQDLLQQIDPNYYRSARLLIVRAELEQLRHGRSVFVDVERRSKIPLGMSRSPDRCIQLVVRAAIVQSSSPEVNISG